MEQAVRETRFCFFMIFLRGGWVKASAMGSLRGLVGVAALLLHPGRKYFSPMPGVDECTDGA
jgi:hypothetical protein